MRSQKRKILITNKGTNKTVLQTVCSVFDESKFTTNDIIQDLRSCDYRTACYSIFEYVLENVKYVEDPGNNQYVKTPARLIDDGYGDCKSMAIFIASCLYNLGYPCCFRFVSFTQRPIYTHVYVVSSFNGEDIIIDPVERINNQPVFDYAQPFILKKDVKCL